MLNVCKKNTVYKPFKNIKINSPIRFCIILLWVELHDGQLSRAVLKSNISWDILFGALVLGISRNPALKDELFKMAILGFALTEAIALLYETTRAYWGCIGYFLTYQIVVPNCKSSDYRGISNGIYLTIWWTIRKSLPLFNRGSFFLEWPGFKLKNYLQTRIIRNVVKNPFGHKTSKTLKCSDLVQTLINPYAWSVARRHIT